MNGDPNTVRDDVLGALALIEATIQGMADDHDKLRLAFASSALRRANEKLRGYTDDHLAEVIELHPGHSVKVVEGAMTWREKTLCKVLLLVAAIVSDPQWHNDIKNLANHISTYRGETS